MESKAMKVPALIVLLWEELQNFFVGLHLRVVGFRDQLADGDALGNIELSFGVINSTHLKKHIDVSAHFPTGDLARNFWNFDSGGKVHLRSKLSGYITTQF